MLPSSIRLARDDTSLRREVESLLAADDQAQGRLGLESDEVS